MATTEELMEALKRADAAGAADDARKLARMIQTRRQQEQVQPPPEPERSEMSAIDKISGVGTSFTRGALLDWDDELFGAVRAGVDQLIPETETERKARELDDTYQPQTFRESYRQARDDIRENRERFAEENPKTALGLNLAGGFTSPINKVIPRWGMGSGGYGGRGGAALRASLRAATEGAIAGAGAAKEKEDMEAGADRGAAMSAGLNLALRGVGGVVGRSVLHRHIPDDLTVNVPSDAGPTQPVTKPLHLAAPGSIGGNLYRMLFGRIPGAKQRLAEQERPFVEAAHRNVQKLQDEWVGKVDQANIESRLKKATADADLEDYQFNLRGRKKGALERAKTAADDKATNIALDFQHTAAIESLPAHGRHVLDDVNTGDVKSTAGRIATWWRDEAFRGVKDRQFEWGNKGAQALRAKIREKYASDPEFALEVGNALADLSRMTQRLKVAGVANKKFTQEQFDMFLNGKIEAIDGEALMAIRNVFATGANGQSKNAGSLRGVATEIDDFIRGSLPAGARDQFNDEIARYTTARTYMDVARSNRVTTTNMFEPKDWGSAGKKYGGKGMSSKTVPLNQQVEDATSGLKAAKARAKTRQGKIALAAEHDARNARLRRGVERSAADMEANAIKRGFEEARQHGPLADATGELQDIQSAAVPATSTGLSDILSAQVVGSSIPSLPPGRASKVAGGIGLANLATNENVQKALAGQTGWQEQAYAALMRGDMALYNRIISRQAGMEFAE